MSAAQYLLYRIRFGNHRRDSVWMGGRVVEGTGLENQQGCKLFVGSNPTPSARDLSEILRKFRFLGIHPALLYTFLYT